MGRRTPASLTGELPTSAAASTPQATDPHMMLMLCSCWPSDLQTLTVDGCACRGNDEDSPFVCERVCTSDRLLKKLGSLAKEPTRDTCVTVCGVSGACLQQPQHPVLLSPPMQLHASQTAAPVTASQPPGMCSHTNVRLLLPAVLTAAHDACTDACQRAVCSIPHQVPAWNDSCIKRCTAECLKGRAS